MNRLLMGLALLASASPASAQDAVVVARAVDGAGPWTPCGRAHVRGEVLFETVEVERGSFAPRRFVAVYNCPNSRRVQGTLRLTLSGTVPRGGSVWGTRPDASLPRFFVRSEELVFAASVAPLLTRRRVWVEAQYPNARRDGDWTHFDDRVSVRFARGRAVEVRASVPTSTSTCSAIATWAGFADARPGLRRRDGCEWPGISDRHRLGTGVSGSVARGVFSVVSAD